MSYGYDRFPGQPYGHYADEREVPDDIDGKPPADFPYNQPYSQPSSSSRFWRPPSFRGGPDYYPSPTRRDPRDRYSGYPPSGYQDTGYGRGPESGYPPAAYLPQEYDRRPRPHRREPEAGPRYDAGAGYPPPPYEPEGRYTSPDRGPPPPPPPPTGPPAPRGPPPMEGTPVFPPMPYEPAGSPASTGPLAEESAALPQEPPAEVFPPLPYEPEGPPPPEEVPYPPPGEDRGEGGPGGGALPEGHYGSPSTVHGHVKTQHFAGCKDYWAAFLFILHFWAVVGVCIYLGLRGVIKTNQNNDLIHAHYLAPAPAPALPHHLYSIRNWAPQLGAAAGSGWIFALIWQSLLRMFPKPMIYVCLSMGAVATGLLGIILISTGTAKGLVGLIFLVSALFQGLYVHLVQPRIPFAAIMLNKALRDVQMHKMLYVVSTWTSLLGMFWLALWIFGVSGAVSLPYGGWYVALLVISLAWSVEVLRNVVNVTVARVVGTVYFEEGNLPLFLVLNAYRRAWTIAFGSICLGSMFVAIVQGLYAVAKRLANEQGENEFLFSCVNCFLGLQEHLIQYFNKWAYVQVGLHGRSFLKASRYTWEMLRDQKADLLINDDLTGSVLLTCCIIGGVLTALVGGCWTFATFRYLTVAISIISFFIGFFVTYLTMVVPESAVATLYICFAEDPETLRKHDPACHQYMDDRRSQLEQSIAE